MWRTGCGLLAVLLLTCSTVRAQGGPLEGTRRTEVLTAIAAAQKPLPGKTLKYTFRQVKHSPLLAEDAVSKGHLVLTDRTMRWQYDEPMDFTLVVEGDSIYTVTGGKRNRPGGTADKMTRGMAQTMRQLTDGTSMADERLFATVLTEEGGCYRATLTPKRRDLKRMMQQVVLTFDRKSLRIMSVRLVEKENSYTQIEFETKRMSQ